MAEQRLDDINVNFNGTQQAASDIDKVANSMEGLAESQEQVTTATENTTAAQAAAAQTAGQLAQRAVDVTGKIAAVSAVVQTLAAAFGTENNTAALVGRMAGAASQGAALGLTLGPTGALVGGITGALLPALTDLITSLNEEETASREAREAEQEHERQLRDLAEAANTAESRIARLNIALRENARNSRLNLGVATDLEYAEEIERVSSTITTLEERIRTLQAGGVRESRASSLPEEVLTAYRGFNTELETARTRLAELQRLRSSANAESADIMGEDLNRSANPTRTGSGTPVDNSQGQATDSLSASGARQEMIDLEDRLLERRYETLDTLNRELNLLQQIGETQNVNARENTTQTDEALSNQQKLADELNRQEEEAQKISDNLTGIAVESFSTMSGALVDYVKAAAAGEESQEALLKGFLEYISQWATFQAIGEFAQAIASFASQDYSGGALHLVAGAAFTALAVGTGVGAAAISPPAAAAPPQQNTESDSSSGGGTTYVINYNSQVVTAGTTSELGRQMGQIIGQGDRRFGRG